MYRKGVKIKQHDITDCGAACLASVCAHYGLRFPVARIRQYAFTDQKGTNVLGLIEAANKLGLSAKGVKAQFEALQIVPKPTIAHVVVHERLQHFVVLYKAEKGARHLPWKLALITLVSAPLFMLIFWGFNRLNKKYQRSIMESSAELESQLVESINSIATIKRFGIEAFANLKTESRFVHLLRNTFQSIYGAIMAQGGIQFVSTAITIVVLWVGSLLVIDRELTPGTLMVFYSLISYVVSPIGSLIASNQTIQDALIAADRLFQIMDLEREQDDSRKIALKPDMIGDISFEDVFFRYGSRKEVFKGLNLKIEQGKTTAIIGESGSGKTTLVSLLQHIYPIQSGRIRIGDYDIAQIDNKSLRRRIGTVPQQIELFAGTVVENIAIGDLNPDMKRIVDLSEQLGLKQFIERLPNGYNTYIGEHGASLSGGERQRIAIARALYKEPEILIFDEATSSLDTSSERYVKQTLKALAQKGKTVIIIAHRLNTVKEADRVVVIDRGKVVENGTHQELFRLGGIYSRLWTEQFEILD